MPVNTCIGPGTNGYPMLSTDSHIRSQEYKDVSNNAFLDDKIKLNRAFANIDKVARERPRGVLVHGKSFDSSTLAYNSEKARNKKFLRRGLAVSIEEFEAEDLVQNFNRDPFFDRDKKFNRTDQNLNTFSETSCSHTCNAVIPPDNTNICSTNYDVDPVSYNRSHAPVTNYPFFSDESNSNVGGSSVPSEHSDFDKYSSNSENSKATETVVEGTQVDNLNSTIPRIKRFPFCKSFSEDQGTSRNTHPYLGHNIYNSPYCPVACSENYPSVSVIDNPCTFEITSRTLTPGFSDHGQPDPKPVNFQSEESKPVKLFKKTLVYAEGGKINVLGTAWRWISRTLLYIFYLCVFVAIAIYTSSFVGMAVQPITVFLIALSLFLFTFILLCVCLGVLL